MYELDQYPESGPGHRHRFDLNISGSTRPQYLNMGHSTSNEMMAHALRPGPGHRHRFDLNISGSTRPQYLNMGHSTSNEMMAHALRPQILVNFLVCCPIIQMNKI